MAEAKIAKRVEGFVVSSKPNQTITVSVVRQVKHAQYGKYIKRTTKFHAHDPENVCREGDLVTIEECAPLSKLKCWRLVGVVQQSRQAV